MITLYETKRKKIYYIKNILPCDDRIRLMELGLINTKILVKAIGFRKGVFLIALRGFEIIIAKELSRYIEVEECSL